MKKLVLMLATIVLSSSLFVPQDADASSKIGLGNPNCSVGDQPLVFTKIEDPAESIGLYSAIAKIDNESHLLYTYNIFYSIGGQVRFVSPQVRVDLLSWDGIGGGVHKGVVEYKGISIFCRL